MSLSESEKRESVTLMRALSMAKPLGEELWSQFREKAGILGVSA